MIVLSHLKFNGRTNQFISMVLFKTERRGNLYQIGVCGPTLYCLEGVSSRVDGVIATRKNMGCDNTAFKRIVHV